jgi:hypothetical protein
MKVKTLLLTALLTLQLGVFAGSGEWETAMKGTMVPSLTEMLSPVTPREATFEEVTETTTFNVAAIAPVAPAHADFSDTVENSTIIIGNIAPVTPAEADFE